MDQIVQVAGSLLILTAFIAAQRGSLSTRSRSYLSLNFVGASVLAVVAAHERHYGLLLLKFCWALVAARSLIRATRRAERHNVRATRTPSRAKHRRER